MHRRLMIRSNPPGATVYVDNQEIGRTPVATAFIYYGTRNIRLELDGYETIDELHRIREPWYQIPPLDFVSENLVRRDIRDERILEFQMVPRAVVPREQLIQRANNLRQGSQMGVLAPLPNPPTGPGGAPMPRRLPETATAVPSGIPPFPSRTFADPPLLQAPGEFKPSQAPGFAAPPPSNLVPGQYPPPGSTGSF